MADVKWRHDIGQCVKGCGYCKDAEILRLRAQVAERDAVLERLVTLQREDAMDMPKWPLVWDKAWSDARRLTQGKEEKA